MIQFVRYLSMVKEQGGTVVVESQPELARLISTVPGADKVVIRGSSAPPFDVYAPLLSLPRIFGSSIEDIPDRVPYLAPPELHNVHLPVPIGTHLKVGIAWAGKRSHKNDRNRSCALTEFINLMGLPGVAFYSLQKGEAAGELEDAACAALIADAGRLIEDFADTAAVIAQLDLVIAVDTAVVHLAGALGRPVWPCCRSPTTGAGWSSAKTAPGIRRSACSARNARTIGKVSWAGCKRRCGTWRFARSSRRASHSQK